MSESRAPAGVDPSVLLLTLLALGVGHGAAIGLLVGSLVLPNPARMLRRGPPPERFGLNPDPVVLGDGTRAWYFANPGATHAVLVCHGRSRSKRWMLPLVAALGERYAVLAVDFPGHGENGYGPTTLGPREAGTVRSALSWLASCGHEAVLVYGVSMGGAASVLALGGAPAENARALVTDGAFDRVSSVVDHVARRLPLPRYVRRLGIAGARRAVGVQRGSPDPVDVAPRITVPCLFVHGDRDPLVPPSCAERLAAATPGSRHALYPGRHDEPDNAAMQGLVLDFFEGVSSGAPHDRGAGAVHG